MSKEYLVYYRRSSMGGGYTTDEKWFRSGPAAKDNDGYLASGHYATDDDARYAAFAFIVDVQRKWPEFCQYPYRPIELYERETGDWTVLDTGVPYEKPG